MQITELTLKNFRCFQETSFEFKSGITGVIGVNGSGKSSIIEALTFLFIGEGYDDKKDLMLAGTNSQAYVQGKFILDGKEGVLTRHLDTSKVHLKYNDIVYHKATEVKELWAKLLQIDGHIFKHVIVGRQNQIPELFDGDSSVREKVFQKIFMVPNTERLRTVIWESYIKNAPPPLPEEDELLLNNRIIEGQAKLAQLQEHQSHIADSLLTESIISRILNSLNYYNRCISDAKLKPAITAKLADYQRQQIQANQQLANIQAQCDPNKITLLQQRQQQLQLDKDKANRAADLTAKIKTLESGLFTTDPQIFQQLGVLAEELREKVNKLSSEKAVVFNRLNQLQVEMEGYQTLTANPICPTCGQSLPDVSKRLKEVSKEVKDLDTKHTALINLLNSANSDYAVINQQLSQTGNFNYWLKLKKDIEPLQGVTYDLTEDRQVTNELNRLNNLNKQLADLNLTIVYLTGEIAVLNEKLNSLVTYEGSGSPELELSAMQEALDINKRRMVEVNELASAIATVKAELAVIDKQLSDSRQNKLKNAKRTAYLNKLRLAYDTLHVTRFPRTLIQTYRGTLEEELSMQLQRFNLPYLIRINDEFKFVILTHDEHVVPSLSGGQKMIVGLCLRLALHSLFAQAFPMLIIDEGTTNLDVQKREQYFQCIKNLREQQSIGQVILIDHDEGLADCVDQTINLTP